MDDDIELDILSYFQRVPHKGLVRIIATLEVLGVATVHRKWVSRGDENFPRIEYLPEGIYKLSIGVTRQPFIGFTSWLSLHAVDENGERTSTLLLLHREADQVWLRSWSKGMRPDPCIDPLVRGWFPPGQNEQKLEHEGLVNATLQHLINILHEG